MGYSYKIEVKFVLFVLMGGITRLVGRDSVTETSSMQYSLNLQVIAYEAFPDQTTIDQPS